MWIQYTKSRSALFLVRRRKPTRRPNQAFFLLNQSSLGITAIINTRNALADISRYVV